MKRATAAFVVILVALLSAPAFCDDQDDFMTQYLQSVSLFFPMAAHSVRDVMSESKGGKPRPSLPSSVDFFSYVSHRPLEIPEGLRAMVFVPHPDDESIAAAGLIQRIIQKGGRVAVVFVTNGDGYVEAVRLRVKNARITAKDFIEYGKKRQEEGTQAVCELGVPAEDVIYLGFPDDGIDDLWESYWSNLKPFISPYTLFDRPHRKGMNRWVKYSGVDLNQEIGRVLGEFMPDWVVLPDPRDQHPDHATTGVFVLDALRRMYQAGEWPASSGRVLSYIVHFKDFPHGTQWAKAIRGCSVGRCANSGKTLSDAEWVELPLTPEEMEGKRRALLSHASQLQMLQGFFKYFLIPSELFGSLNMAQVITVPEEYAAFFKHPSGEAADNNSDTTP